MLVIARGGPLENEDEKQSQPESSITTEAIVVENVMVAQTSDVETTTETAKRTLPTIETPAHLKDNLFLKVVCAQLKLLLDEMDNTKEEDWPMEKTPSSGEDHPLMGMFGSHFRDFYYQ